MYICTQYTSADVHFTHPALLHIYRHTQTQRPCTHNMCVSQHYSNTTISMCTHTCVYILNTPRELHYQPVTHVEITFRNNCNGISSQSFSTDSVPNQLAFSGKMIAPEGMGIGMKAEIRNRSSSLKVAWSVYMHVYSKYKMIYIYKVIVNTNSQYAHSQAHFNEKGPCCCSVVVMLSPVSVSNQMHSLTERA